MTRVLMTANAVGGVWQYAIELAGALADHDVETVLAVLGPEPSRRQRECGRMVPDLVIERGDFPLEWMADASDDKLDAAGRWLLELAERHDPDLVHVNGYAHAALPWRRPVVCVAHSDLFSWWRAVHPGEEPPREWRRYRERAAAGLGAADAVATPSLHLLRELLCDYGPVMAAAVIPNGRTTGLHAASGSQGPPLGSKEPLILGVGRLWDEGKNLRALAEAAPQVPWPVAIAGAARPPHGGPEVKLLGVVSLGRLDDEQLAEWMGRAAVFAHPARYEPFGLAVLEAALAGCALVLGDVPSLREVWGDAAAFVPPEDPAALAAELRRCAEDSEHRRRLARAAYRRAGDYSPGRMARGYLDLYREAARRHRTVACRPALEAVRLPGVRAAGVPV